MCGCTLYDSPTCGHSWLSMSQPCGFLFDLLSCSNRYTYQTLIAPPYVCPVCNHGFADCETVEMVQGPWGCNQLLRNQFGGVQSIPGQWGQLRLISGYGRAAMQGTPYPFISSMGYNPAHTTTMGPPASSASLNPMMAPIGSGQAVISSHDHRLMGPSSIHPQIVNNVAPCHTNTNYRDYEDRFVDYDFSSSRRNGKHKSQYKYHHKVGPSTNCVIM